MGSVRAPMRKVDSVESLEFTETAHHRDGSKTHKFRVRHIYTLSCGHRLVRVDYTGSRPSARLGCKACKAEGVTRG